MPPSPKHLAPSRPSGRDEGRQQVLAAAAQAFMDRGFEGASIDDIADILSATKGRVYHYYRSKSDILLDIHKQLLQLMVPPIQKLATGNEDPLVLLERAADHHLRCVLENAAFARVTLISSVRISEGNERQRAIAQDILQTRREYTATFQDLIERALRAGRTRDLDPTIASRAMLGTLNWVVMWYRDTAEPHTATSRDLITHELVTYAISGLLPRDGHADARDRDPRRSRRTLHS
jgi:AcrR family transcriptional regulator